MFLPFSCTSLIARGLERTRCWLFHVFGKSRENDFFKKHWSKTNLMSHNGPITFATFLKKVNTCSQLFLSRFLHGRNVLLFFLYIWTDWLLFSSYLVAGMPVQSETTTGKFSDTPLGTRWNYLVLREIFLYFYAMLKLSIMTLTWFSYALLSLFKNANFDNVRFRTAKFN